MLPAVAHLTASGLVINDHGSIHATADEVRPSRGYCNNDLTNPARCPGFPLPLGEGNIPDIVSVPISGRQNRPGPPDRRLLRFTGTKARSPQLRVCPLISAPQPAWTVRPALVQVHRAKSPVVQTSGLPPYPAHHVPFRSTL